MPGRFEYAQAEEIRDAFARHGVRYLFLGKSGAILLGYPDTTQDADLFVEKSADQRFSCSSARRSGSWDASSLNWTTRLPRSYGARISFRSRAGRSIST